MYQLLCSKVISMRFIMFDFRVKNIKTYKLESDYRISLNALLVVFKCVEGHFLCK